MRQHSFTRAGTVVLAGLVCLSAGCGSSNDVTIQGSGATFPAPLYKRWFLEYYRGHSDVRVNYQPIGSGAGIRQFTEGLTFFGASDAFMSKDEIAKVPESRGVVLIPMTAGSIVLCYNMPDAGDNLQLTRKVYVDIFLGKITSWADPAIREANKGLSLPDKPITVVRRADSSGTTNAFTNHLVAISEDWKKAKGPKATKEISSEPGQSNMIAGKGNSGVAALIQQTPGAIGYLEFGYAELSHLPMAHLQNKYSLENKTGKFIKPSPESGAAALTASSLKSIPAEKLKVLNFDVPDPAGEDAYPMVTCTWLICAKNYDNARKATELKNVIKYALTDGQKISGELGYIPLPEEVRNAGLKALEQIKP